MNTELEAYVEKVCGDIQFESAEILAKILTSNDDSGRHGVLIPSESYSFFPELPIDDPEANATLLFEGLDAMSEESKKFGWKYYQRYPERRITRLNSKLNDVGHGRRLAIFIRLDLAHDISLYVTDALVEGIDENFCALAGSIFGNDVAVTPGAFIRVPLDAPTFHIDDALSNLLELYEPGQCTRLD